MNQRHHRPLTLDFLRSFEAVARRLSFSGAAEELHITQPAISRQIKALEDELGAPLFVRGTRKVELSNAGQSLLRTVEPMLARLDATVRQIRITRGRAQVVVSTFPSFASLWLMPRLASFEREHPSIDIRISATDRLIDPDDPEVDLLLRNCLPERAPPGAQRMFGEVLTPVIGARLADAIARGEAPPLTLPADLAQHTLLEMEDGSPSSVLFAWPNWLAPHGLGSLVPRRWISVNYTHQQVQAAAAGHGVALARMSMVHDMLERGELLEPFGPGLRTPSRYSYWLVTSQAADRTARPELAAFGAWVLGHSAGTRVALGETLGKAPGDAPG